MQRNEVAVNVTVRKRCYSERLGPLELLCSFDSESSAMGIMKLSYNSGLLKNCCCKIHIPRKKKPVFACFLKIVYHEITFKLLIFVLLDNETAE